MRPLDVLLAAEPLRPPGTVITLADALMLERRSNGAVVYEELAAWRLTEPLAEALAALRNEETYGWRVAVGETERRYLRALGLVD